MGSSVRSWVIVMSMVVLASSASLDVDLCAKGEAIWCQSLEAAEVCSAVDHCTETIWKNQKLEKDESNVCIFCESVISSARQMSKAGKSQEEVTAFLSSASDLLPDSDKALQIKKTIDRKSIPIILNSDITPQMVCRLLDLCQGPQVELDLHKLDSSPEEQPLEWKAVVDIYCQDCTNFFSALKKLATGPTTFQRMYVADTVALDKSLPVLWMELNHALVSDIIVEKVCTRTTTYRKQCEDVAKNYLSETIRVLTSFLDETQVCKAIRLCKNSQTGVNGDSSEVDFGSVDWEELISVLTRLPQSGRWDGPQQPILCTDCNNFFKSLKAFLQGETPPFITDILLDQVCSRLKKGRQQCEATVKVAVPSVITFAANFIDPGQICKATKLCLMSQQNSENDMNNIRWTKLILPNETNMLLNQPNSCPDCTKFFAAIRTLVKDDAAGFLSDIMVDQICPLTGTYRKQCEDLTKTYLPVAIGLVASTLDPDKVCKSIGMCKKSEGEIDISFIDWNTFIGDQMLLNQPNSCPDCTKFFAAIRTLVKDDAAGFLSDVIIDQICPLTGAYRKQCEDLTKTYLPVAIGLIASTLDPDKVCKAIGMCKKSDGEIDLGSIDWKAFIGDQMLLNQPNSCPDCTKFFAAIRTLVKDDASAFISDVMVDQICPLTGAFRKQCEDLTKTYLPVAIGLVASTLDPDKLCKSIGMCKKSEDEIEDSDLFVIDLSSIDWETLIGNLGDSKCDGCKKAVQFVQIFVKSESVKSTIAFIVDKFVCAQLGPFRLPCDKILATELRTVLDLLARLLDPSKVCHIIRLCKISGVFMDDDDVANDDSLPVLDQSEDLDVVECSACETVIGVVRAAIDTNMTKDDVLKSMHGLCALLPTGSAVAVRCDGFASDYGQQVIESIRRKLQPKDICMKMELCNVFNFDLLDVAAVMGSEQCIVCRSTVQYLEALMYQTDTLAMIQSQLKTLCHSLPPTVEQDVCLPFVTKYVPQLIYELSVLLPPKFFCTKIGICSD